MFNSTIKLSACTITFLSLDHSYSCCGFQEVSYELCKRLSEHFSVLISTSTEKDEFRNFFKNVLETLCTGDGRKSSKCFSGIFGSDPDDINGRS